MNKTFSLKNHLMHNFYYYIGSAIIVSAIFNYLVDLKLRAKDFEKLSIFIAETNVDKTNLKKHLESIFQDQIYEYNIYTSNPKGSQYGNQYFTQGFSSDLMILPESSIVESDMQYYLPLPVDYQNENNFIINDKQIGYQIFNGEDGYYKDFINYQNDKYYLFINTDSVHLNNLDEKEYKTNFVEQILKDMKNV